LGQGSSLHLVPKLCFVTAINWLQLGSNIAFLPKKKYKLIRNHPVFFWHLVVLASLFLSVILSVAQALDSSVATLPQNDRDKKFFLRIALVFRLTTRPDKAEKRKESSTWT
jgi:hypothetical protein